MAWCQTGDKPLPEPKITQSTDTYMQHSGEVCYTDNEMGARTANPESSVYSVSDCC